MIEYRWSNLFLIFARYIGERHSICDSVSGALKWKRFSNSDPHDASQSCIYLYLSSHFNNILFIRSLSCWEDVTFLQPDDMLSTVTMWKIAIIVAWYILSNNQNKKKSRNLPVTKLFQCHVYLRQMRVLHISVINFITCHEPKQSHVPLISFHFI